MYGELETFAQQYIDEFGAAHEDISSVSIAGRMITIDTDEYWNYGGHDTNIHYIPVEYLCDANWIEKEKARLETTRIAEEKAKHQQLTDKRNKESEDEKQTYVKLREKYGEQSCI